MVVIRILLSTRLGELRMKQIELSRAAGIRAATINGYYWDLVDKVSLTDLDLICEALDCDISEILVRVQNDDGSVRSRMGKKISGVPQKRGKQ